MLPEAVAPVQRRLVGMSGRKDRTAAFCAETAQKKAAVAGGY
jgi:hypothetical protein